MPYAIAAVIIVIGGAVTYFFFNTPPEETMPNPPSAISRQEGSTDAQDLPTDQSEGSDVASGEVVLESAADANAEGSAAMDLPANDSDGPSGTYSADASYLTPRRTEHEITVELTVADGIVTEADVTYGGPNGTTENPNQASFDEAFRAEVVGQPIDEIELSRVGGASLTSNAFNEALGNIEAEASAS